MKISEISFVLLQMWSSVNKVCYVSVAHEFFALSLFSLWFPELTLRAARSEPNQNKALKVDLVTERVPLLATGYWPHCQLLLLAAPTKMECGWTCDDVGDKLESLFVVVNTHGVGFNGKPNGRKKQQQHRIANAF